MEAVGASAVPRTGRRRRAAPAAGGPVAICPVPGGSPATVPSPGPAPVPTVSPGSRDPTVLTPGHRSRATGPEDTLRCVQQRPCPQPSLQPSVQLPEASAPLAPSLVAPCGVLLAPPDPSTLGAGPQTCGPPDPGRPLAVIWRARKAWQGRWSSATANYAGSAGPRAPAAPPAGRAALAPSASPGAAPLARWEGPGSPYRPEAAAPRRGRPVIDEAWELVPEFN